ncbi:very short patch repair endonuclease [Bradyrhizobium erythrophlei]|uniref:Very short patch repair endonuclease n=1 Tax=Bradyrhizobium erythrophlei TaxID=1437360 RepID=A0A1H4SES8_9BRAD|nr:very short patch repair endonuclease [Bradyrhizobium erythrophlei]SEC42732.1 T/G mismatch-specific endonuclease [Bradyrhizobium erythrophlei]
MDTLTKAQRSERMARIRSKNTAPELAVRQALFKLGYRYQLHRKDLPGKPDLVFPSRKKIVFVHGCFWHAHNSCSVANMPKSRTEFWQAKFQRNVERDKLNKRALRRMGWSTLTVWECEIKRPDRLLRRVTGYLGPTGAKVKKGRSS